ncbi:GGDEF domain-containing protein [Shewanella aestuarii]|uniref:Diguanylate cyclase n=1 Tax=Shewanella aestuarii TaxID=1028752 RepID=A0A6G9QLS9_9GAMM|nr:diguanylate cyclase [Shewanella aestuarii]QIR15432.1 diguanylate cyclase [Shewanella aestuarii]
MDAFILHLIIVIVSAVMVITFSIFYVIGHKQRCLLDWTIAGGLFLVSSTIGLLSYYVTLPYWLGPAAANGLYVLAHLGLLVGLRRHFQLAPQWIPVIYIAVLVFFIHYIPGLLETLTHRLLYIYPLLMLISISTVITVLRNTKQQTLLLTYYPLMLAELIFFGQQLVRFVFVAFDQTFPLTELGSQLLLESGTLAVIVFLTLMTLACCLIVSRQQQAHLHQATQVDKLTGLLTKPSLVLQASQCFNPDSQQQKLSFLLVEVADIERVNQDFGSNVTDDVIKHVADIVQHIANVQHEVFRLNERKFVVLSTHFDLAQLQGLTQRIHLKVACCRLNTLPKEISVAVNIGFALQTKDDHSWQTILQRAGAELKNPTLQVKPQQQQGSKLHNIMSFGLHS